MVENAELENAEGRKDRQCVLKFTRQDCGSRKCGKKLTIPQFCSTSVV